MARNGKSGRKWVIASAVLVLLIAGAGFGLRAALKTDPKIDASRLANVERGDIARSVVATGKIQPRTQVEVKSKASGIVKKIYADYGEYVKAGQVLVELDKEDLQARVREASALILAAEAAEQSASASYERNKVEAQGPDIPFLKSAFDRAKKLYTQGLIASNTMEDAERAYQLALHKQASAERGVSVAKADMAKAKAQVAQARAALDRAQEAAGEGLRVGQQQQSDNLGKDLMIVFAGRTSLQTGGARAGRKVFWNVTDPAAITREATACRYVLPEQGRGDVPIRSALNSASLMVTGSLPPFQEIRSIAVGEGRFYDWADNAEGRRVAVLGSDARKQLFGTGEAVGASIRIGDFPYTVVGVMAFKEQDSSYDGRDVNKVFVPVAAMLRDFPNKPPMPPQSIDQILATPKSVPEHDECKLQIRRALARIYGFSPRDKEAVPVWDTVENVQRFEAMTTGMKYFLGAVGVVTLLLGGIGVMNVMLVAVRERTREIGVRKAVGATRTSILLQFFAETMLIVIFSGGTGMAVAFALCAAVNSMKMPPFFAGLLATPSTSLLSAGLLGLIAIGAAMYPATRAASVDPIEALRYEAGG